MLASPNPTYVGRLTSNPVYSKILWTVRYIGRYPWTLLRTRLKPCPLRQNYNKTVPNIRDCKGRIIELALSDHTGQLLECPVRKYCTLDYWFVKKRDYHKDNLDKFKECLSNLSFSESLTSSNANVASNELNEIFVLYHLCFPVIKIKCSSSVRPRWISKGIRRCSKRKRELLWAYRRAPN